MLTSTQVLEPEAVGVAARIDWSLASCKAADGVLAEKFFSERIDDITAAKAICESCRLAEACLEGAISRSEPWGVWGGELFWNGKILPYKRKRGRPPKVQPAAETEAIARYRDRFIVEQVGVTA